MIRLAYIAVVVVASPAAAADLAAVMARLDSSAASFQSVTADIAKEDYTAVLQDTTTEAGSIRLLRSKASRTETLVLMEFTKPDPRKVALGPRKAEVFYPKMSTVQEWDIRKYKNLVDQLLLLGFGSSSSDLSRAYSVKSLGVETIAGQAVDHLDLVPKNKETLKHLSRVELWVSAAGYPLRQRFHEPSGNHKTVNYSNLKVNPGLTTSDVTLNLPANVVREYPGK
jgi:outer membrane lipoprotein-sorting protein